MSGLRAPARTATPTPELPSACTSPTRPCLRSASRASAVRIRRSAFAPFSSEATIACVASKRISTPERKFSRTPFSARELRTIGALLRLDAGGFRHFRELRDLALDVRGKLLGRARAHIEALGAERVLHIGPRQHLEHVRVQPRYDGCGR